MTLIIYDAITLYVRVYMREIMVTRVASPVTLGNAPGLR